MSFLDSSMHYSVITWIQLLRLVLFVGNCINLSLLALTRGHEGMNLIRVLKMGCDYNLLRKQIINASHGGRSVINQNSHTGLHKRETVIEKRNVAAESKNMKIYMLSSLHHCRRDRSIFGRIVIHAYVEIVDMSSHLWAIQSRIALIVFHWFKFIEG